MPVYKAIVYITDSQQELDQNYTVNFHVTNPLSADNAWSDANNISQAISGTLLPNWCRVTKVAIINPDVVNGVQYRDVNHVGVRGSTGDSLPSWNTVKFQARTMFGGRPSTFHLRMGLTEDDVDGQEITTDVADALDSFIVALGLTGAMCKADGEEFSLYSYDVRLRARQQGWHRRSRPGFKRGYVPVGP